jgi:SAM-dependent methyltransferase
MKQENVDEAVVNGFGSEWRTYDQSGLQEKELQTLFDAYFEIFPWDRLPDNAVGIDLGCGSGRWAKFVAPRIGTLHCIDPSEEALAVARRQLEGQDNCEFHLAGAHNIPLPDESVDFGYCLGVLHHVPDTAAALRALVKKLKPGATLLLYLYYAFDNRPLGFRAIWQISDVLRQGISRLPFPLRYRLSQMIGIFIYFPLARAAALMETAGMDVASFPLSYYRRRSLYVMCNDALDRFGTKVEHRFTRNEMAAIMAASGLTDIIFKPTAPFWCAVGVRSR